MLLIHSSGRGEYLNPLERLRREEIEERRVPSTASDSYS
jgi:hypothetical protein